MKRANQQIAVVAVVTGVCALAMLLLAGCATVENDSWWVNASRDAGLAEEFARRKAAAAPPAADYERLAQQVSLQEQAPPAMAGVKRIVIYTAMFRIVVKEIEAAIGETETLAAELGGWVQAIQGDSITIRVPADKYEPAVERMQKLGRVSHRDLQAADVTEEYVDLEARLKNAEAVRNRLLGLLEKAEDVKAALEVEKELARVGQEIEQLKAKLELLKNRVAYSTITATFERVYRATPTQQLVRLPFAWLQELNPNRLVERY